MHPCKIRRPNKPDNQIHVFGIYMELIRRELDGVEVVAELDFGALQSVVSAFHGVLKTNSVRGRRWSIEMFRVQVAKLRTPSTGYSAAGRLYPMSSNLTSGLGLHDLTADQ